jgi:hypothetical protein
VRLLILLVAAASACAGDPTPKGGPVASPGDAGPAEGSAGDALAPPESDAGPHVVGTIYSGVPWLDTAGNLVNAHGVGFIQVGNTYYMVGEQRSGANDTYSGAPINAEDTFTGVSMYATRDFASWTFVGTVVQPVPGTILAPPYYGERPKILFNAPTGQYRIYVKMLDYTGNPPVYVGQYAVLTSDAIAGPYTYFGTLGGGGASDFQVFQDDDGSQYLAQAGGALYRFSSSGLSLLGQVGESDGSGEGVSLFKAGGTYFWQSSQGTYWKANDNSYATATALAGTWADRGYFCPAGTMTWDSQDTAVVPIVGSSGTTYVYVGDRWVNGDLPASTLVVQPLAVTGSTESIATYQPVWSLDVTAGTWSPVTVAGASINDDAIGTGADEFTYDSSWTAGPCAGCAGGDAHSSSTADAVATFAFTGSQVLLYSSYDASSGIMGVTLSDAAGNALTPEVRVSLRYDAPPAGDAMVYASPVVPSASYLLTVRVTGLADLYSGGTACHIDRVQVLP